jgi:hypothetical protein
MTFEYEDAVPTIIGIDEAGYGPQLGPLVIGAAAFDIPDGADPEKMWDLLAGSVSRNRRGAGDRLIVADSKVVYSGGKGLDRLERAVLAFIGASGGAVPTRFSELLSALCGDAAPPCDTAWWDDLLLPVAADPATLAPAIEQLSDARCLGLSTRVVPAGAFNRLVTKYDNKSVIVFVQNMSLVDEMIGSHPGDLWFKIDKHGGRHYYDELLANHFFGRPVHEHHASPKTSSYEVHLPDRRLFFTFAEKADSTHLTVALASMAAKYIRELYMMCFNAYWCGRVDGLAPTAGYATDSRRFINAIRPLFAEHDERDIIRTR